MLCKVGCESLVICLPYHSMLSFAFRCFFLCVANYIRPPPSFGSWFDTLHLWPIVRPHGDPFLSLCPLWGKDCIPWCHLEFFCVHCERCKVSYFVGVNPCFFIIFCLIFSLVGSHCFLDWWRSHIGGCHHCWPHLSRLGITSGFFWRGDYDIDGSNEGRILLQLLL